MPSSSRYNQDISIFANVASETTVLLGTAISVSGVLLLPGVALQQLNTADKSAGIIWRAHSNLSHQQAKFAALASIIRIIQMTWPASAKGAAQKCTVIRTRKHAEEALSSEPSEKNELPSQVVIISLLSWSLAMSESAIVGKRSNDTIHHNAAALSREHVMPNLSGRGVKDLIYYRFAGFIPRTAKNFFQIGIFPFREELEKSLLRKEVEPKTAAIFATLVTGALSGPLTNIFSCFYQCQVIQMCNKTLKTPSISKIVLAQVKDPQFIRKNFWSSRTLCASGYAVVALTVVPIAEAAAIKYAAPPVVRGIGFFESKLHTNLADKKALLQHSVNKIEPFKEPGLPGMGFC